MPRSFGSRPVTAVTDKPLYAHYENGDTKIGPMTVRLSALYAQRTARSGTRVVA